MLPDVDDVIREVGGAAVPTRPRMPRGAVLEDDEIELLAARVAHLAGADEEAPAVVVGLAPEPLVACHEPLAPEGHDATQRESEPLGRDRRAGRERGQLARQPLALPLQSSARFVQFGELLGGGVLRLPLSGLGEGRPCRRWRAVLVAMAAPSVDGNIHRVAVLAARHDAHDHRARALEAPRGERLPIPAPALRTRTSRHAANRNRVTFLLQSEQRYCIQACSVIRSTCGATGCRPRSQGCGVRSRRGARSVRHRRPPGRRTASDAPGSPTRPWRPGADRRRGAPRCRAPSRGHPG